MSEKDRRIIVEPPSDELDRLRRETQTALLRKIDELNAEVERLNLALLRIGEFAVVDFDDATVGEVDRAISPKLKTYRTEIARLTAEVTQLKRAKR